MLAFNQSLGSSPVLIDFWYIIENPGASCFEHSLRILLGIPSGPEAFDGFSCRSSFSTPSCFILRNGIECFMCFVVFGSVLSLSLVNTDLNCCISISAFPLLSLTNWPLFFRGDTPMLSYFLVFMYFQKSFGLLFSSPSIMVLLMYSHSAFRACLLHSF